jgi:hypothetical protein
VHITSMTHGNVIGFWPACISEDPTEPLTTGCWLSSRSKSARALWVAELLRNDSRRHDPVARGVLPADHELIRNAVHRQCSAPVETWVKSPPMLIACWPLAVASVAEFVTPPVPSAVSLATLNVPPLIIVPSP